jgi:DNA-binding CsgD family transcriptional regulator
MNDLGELGQVEIAMYRAVLNHPDALLTEIAAFLDHDADELDKPLRRLAEMGLVCTDVGDRLTAISPMLAEATVLGAEDLELGARRASVEGRRNAIRRLVVDWNEALSIAAPNRVAIDVVSDQAQIGNVMMHYADRCQNELLSVAPGRLPKTRIDSRTRIANLYSARRGVRSRLLYQHAALRDRHTRSYLSELADNGAKIRFASSVPGRSLVIDGYVALLPVPLDDSKHGLVVVHEPNIVNWVIATFEQLWAESQPLEDALSRQGDAAGLDQTRVAILRLMAEGEKDEAISRRLSISVRTCRRQIADYMALVGASSRFQAGVTAARSGHLDGVGQGWTSAQ